MNIGIGQVWERHAGKRRGRRIYVLSAQTDALNPELERVDIEYMPSGRKRHLLMPDAQKLLSQFQLIGERADG